MLIITYYAVSFPLAPGPWAGRNSSIDTGSLEVGRRVTQEVPPGVFWRSLLHLSQPQFLKFNISLGKDALFGVYIRKGLPPSHAQVKSDMKYKCRLHLQGGEANHRVIMLLMGSPLASNDQLKRRKHYKCLCHGIF